MTIHDFFVFKYRQKHTWSLRVEMRHFNNTLKEVLAKGAQKFPNGEVSP